MEDNLLLTIEEHSILLKNKRFLESVYKVQIKVPVVDKNGSCANDVIIACISGDELNISLVKKYLKSLTENYKRKRENNRVMVENIQIITLSDDDSDTACVSVLTPTQNIVKRRRKKTKRQDQVPEQVGNQSAAVQVINQLSTAQVIDLPSDEQVVDLSSTINLCDDSVCDVSSTTETDFNDARLASLPPAAEFIPLNVVRSKRKSVSQNVGLGKKKNASTLRKEEVGSEKGEPLPLHFEAVARLTSLPPAHEFIPLNVEGSKRKFVPQNVGLRKKNAATLQKEQVGSKKGESLPLHIEAVEKEKKDSNEANDSVIILEEEIMPEIPRPVKKDPRLLRPVVIDGSNVAREHGKSNRTYSCKGIQLSVEYFLSRGHSQVTAFVPQYRRHCRFGQIITTDQPLLEELAINQYVVFTPSRRVNGKLFSSYDDRFIVELASKTGGVILSNDNYRDLLDESEDFKKTIQERLLMFCFVGDILMIPNDPLGRHGPSLNDYLSFPTEAADTNPT